LLSISQSPVDIPPAARFRPVLERPAKKTESRRIVDPNCEGCTLGIRFSILALDRSALRGALGAVGGDVRRGVSISGAMSSVTRYHWARPALQQATVDDADWTTGACERRAICRNKDGRRMMGATHEQCPYDRGQRIARCRLQVRHRSRADRDGSHSRCCPMRGRKTSESVKALRAPRSPFP
jgi:hypothetical protein